MGVQRNAIASVVVCVLVAGAVGGVVGSAVAFTGDSATNAQLQQVDEDEPNDDRQTVTDKSLAGQQPKRQRAVPASVSSELSVPSSLRSFSFVVADLAGLLVGQCTASRSMYRKRAKI